MSGRGFSTTAREPLNLIGKVSLQDVKQVNEPIGAQWAENVQIVVSSIESQRTDVASYEIQGAKAHKSSKDPNETQDVITLAFYSHKGTRIGSAHAREDGTYTFQASRAGR
ncbi:uncharacterized protein GLRG_03229 [Colletotrichum graminicola M1.001]|uniref:Uncharacterized protein n=1 Tax=Colletotrichum graminicola (strain M1.001 / M2 / FGSC 10212) TaxID=645133 RepID=E3QB47_COLGM|nr:uncharacterized protein GLRG_03229 [Colletotrichum graminicola M1.001]EFQ28085.1 hypothetical protein GLRG_03229 [Colletotrichum graminicola M1.001]